MKILEADEILTFRVRLLPSEDEVTVPCGTTILEARRIAGQSPDAPCGGRGLCGKCIVEIEEDGKRRKVKSCLYKIERDITVFIPKSADNMQIVTSGGGKDVPFDPIVKEIAFKLPERSLHDARDDRTRLLCALAESGVILQDGELFANPALYGKLSEIAVSEKREGFALLCGGELLSLSVEKEGHFIAAFDIGTTTIAGYLLDGTDGAEICSSACLNSQIQYGGDVVSRASNAVGGGLNELSGAVRKDINMLISELTAKAGAKPEDILAVTVVGNTCMHHLFLGIAPHSLIEVPYNASTSCSMTLKASEYGIKIHPSGKLLMLPLIAGFVGADTVGCLVAADFLSLEAVTLMIDIGTNGELVLGNKERFIACSTAAGPAFEGARIKCGMRAASGAVDHVFLQDDGSIGFTVIGGGKPRGICGSGVIDAAAALYEAGILSKTGRMLRPEKLTGAMGERFSGRLKRLNEELVFYLALPDESASETGVYIMQRDIRELQLGKSAISTGISLLCKKYGIKKADIVEVLLAGGFGNHMNPESLCKIGLIPSELRSKIRAVGNAAGSGAKLAVKNSGVFFKSEAAARKAEFLELALDDEFQKSFLSNIDFPP